MANDPFLRRAVERRSFLRGTGLAVVGGGLWLAGCGGGDDGGGTSSPAGDSDSSAPPGPLTDIRFQLSWVKDSGWAGYWLADADGLYAANGVSADFMTGGPGGPYAEQTIAGGGADMGSTDSFVFVATAIQAGSDLVVLGAKNQGSPACLVSLPENPVESLADLVGKRVGTDPANEALLEALLESEGLEPDISAVPVGTDASALVAGDCDVLVGFVSNQPHDLEAQGIEPVVLKFDDIGFPTYIGIIVASRDFVDGNHDAVVGFLRASILGWETVLAEPERGVELTLTDYGADLGLDPDKEAYSLDVNNELMVSDLTEEKGLFWIDPELVAGPMYDAIGKLGLTDLPDPAGYIDLTLLEEAYDGKTSLLEA